VPSVETLDPDLEPPNPILLVNPWKPPRVTLFNTATYTHAIKLEGLECFKLWISHPEVTGHSTTSETPVDMSSAPQDYHDFAAVFSKSKAGKLADHNHMISRSSLMKAPLSLWSHLLLVSGELAAICKFIDKNLTTGVICPPCSPHGAPVLFICK